jgi:hypothetical protein
MAITPINPNLPSSVTTGGLSIPAGGGVGFVGSGICSGVAFEHNQTAAVFYEWTNAAELDGNWLPGSVTVSGFKCQVSIAAQDFKYDFVTSGNANGTCSGAFNMKQWHNFSFSASDLWDGKAAGTGEKGILYTASAGVTRTRARTTDIEQQDDRYYPNVWYPMYGNNYFLTSDVWAKQLFFRPLINTFQSGGLDYNYTNNAANTQISQPMPLFQTGLVYI